MPDIREEHMNDHFTKFHLGGLPFAAVIHRFTAADGPEADPHSHPWDFTSTILRGGYREEVFTLYPNNEGWRSELHVRRPGDTFRNMSGTIHRIVELLEPECWTLIQPEEGNRVPGFYKFDEHAISHRFWFEPEFHPLTEDRI